MCSFAARAIHPRPERRGFPRILVKKHGYESLSTCKLHSKQHKKTPATPPQRGIEAAPFAVKWSARDIPLRWRGGRREPDGVVAHLCQCGWQIAK